MWLLLGVSGKTQSSNSRQSRLMVPPCGHLKYKLFLCSDPVKLWAICAQQHSAQKILDNIDNIRSCLPRTCRWTLHKVGETLGWRRGEAAHSPQRSLQAVLFTPAHSTPLGSFLPVLSPVWLRGTGVLSPRPTSFISSILQQTVLFLSGGGHHHGVCSFFIFVLGRWQPVWLAHYPKLLCWSIPPSLPFFFNITSFKLKTSSSLSLISHFNCSLFSFFSFCFTVTFNMHCFNVLF